ncbi:hypothetical protein [Streptomyces sp. NPDC051665]|uniref:hypothetical protein n=1 Tax=Streptomyces sp. NPDC051665 TaxID=3154647 RepID=UPI00343438C9
MQQARRRDRRPAHHAGTAQHRFPALAVEIEGADVVIDGYVSGKQKDFAALMDAAARTLEERGRWRCPIPRELF